ncbi:hypothetical protein [Actinophytocola glycyrrhizae]|uniref:SUKH-4 immunity protein of toxin-antitoxin system n=1 Tax=Actinophytocola glycyrrhizae TaxID=2044873 RepID=A0ABV9S020_9PSEU
MSPVSRGRKPKKSKKRRRVQARAVRTVGLGTGKPAWFEPTITAVLDGAVRLESVRGLRETEQLTCELVGAQLHRVIQEGHAGLHFSWWFDELAGAARERDARRLLLGLASIGAPEVDYGLADPPRVTATGEVFRMRDVYGSRFAVLARFSYEDDPCVYLFDIDASEMVRLVSAGVFDDVDQAAAAWLADVGAAAGDVTPRPVEDVGELTCLSQLDIGGLAVFGDESRVAMDNWFRAQRRQDDLAEALAARGMPLPLDESPYDCDSTLMVAEFTAWYENTRGVPPDPDAVASLAEQWMEGALPETWYSVSPRRVETQIALLSDWLPDEPVTIAAKSLLPDWVAWLGERARLPDHLRAAVR